MGIWNGIKTGFGKLGSTAYTGLDKFSNSKYARNAALMGGLSTLADPRRNAAAGLMQGINYADQWQEGEDAKAAAKDKATKEKAKAMKRYFSIGKDGKLKPGRLVNTGDPEDIQKAIDEGLIGKEAAQIHMKQNTKTEGNRGIRGNDLIKTYKEVDDGKGGKKRVGAYIDPATGKEYGDGVFEYNPFMSVGTGYQGENPVQILRGKQNPQELQIIDPSMAGGKDKINVKPQGMEGIAESTAKEIGMFDSIINRLSNVKHLHDDSYTGPIQGRVGAFLDKTGISPDAKRDELRNVTQSLIDLVYGKSGAQINEREMEILTKVLPDMNMPDDMFASRANKTIEVLTDMRNRRLDVARQGGRYVPSDMYNPAQSDLSNESVVQEITEEDLKEADSYLMKYKE